MGREATILLQWGLLTPLLLVVVDEASTESPTFSYLMSGVLWGLMLLGFTVKYAWSRRRGATAAAHHAGGSPGAGRSDGVRGGGRRGKRRS